MTPKEEAKLNQLTYQLQNTTDSTEIQDLINQISDLKATASYEQGLSQGYNQGFQAGAALTTA